MQKVFPLILVAYLKGMYRYLLFLLAFGMIHFNTVFAQHDSAFSVLVIPYHPDFYFSDADHQLAIENDLSIPEVRDQFRSGLQLKLQLRILKQAGIHSTSLLTVQDKLSTDDLLMEIYAGISYQLSPPKVPLLQTTQTAEQDKTWTDKIKAWLPSLEEKPSPEGGIEQPLQTATSDEEYMHAALHDPAMLTYLRQQYGTQYFLFINQFELVTNYEQCLDRAVNNFERTVKVHFTLYNDEGKWLYGNAVSMTTSTRAMHIGDIIDENCIPIANFIAEQIDKPAPVVAAP